MENVNEFFLRHFPSMKLKITRLCCILSSPILGFLSFIDNTKRLFLEIILALVVLICYNNYLHYVLVINQCNWPELLPDNEDFSLPTTNDNLIKIMVISDIHLRCTKPIWYEYPKEDYQMYISFKMAIDRLDPDLVFILGDVIDKGLFCSTEDFHSTLRRFNRIFPIKNRTRLFVIPGNHDIGFHHQIDKNKFQNFVNVFKSPPVQFFSLKKNHFLLLNSMTLEHDGCFFCSIAEKKLAEVEEILKCSEELQRGHCMPNLTLPIYSRPILIQHIPLFRKSDAFCDDYDSAPPPEKFQNRTGYWDCLDEEISSDILNRFKPRLVLSGHMHHGCTRNLPDGITEITIPSFNWRKKNNPTIGLGVLTSTNYAFVRCPIPKLSTVNYIYFCGITCIFLRTFYYCKKIRRSVYEKK